MNSVVILITIGASLFLLEALFFVYCFRWLSSGKRLREKEFARLDTERIELLELQAALTHDLQAAKQLSSEAVQKLAHLGAEANAEWNEMANKVESLTSELAQKLEEVSTAQLHQLNKTRLSVDKSLKDSIQINAKLVDTMQSAQRILKFFDQNIPAEQIIKDLQAEKYSEARKLLEQGMDASQIAKKLSMPLSEVSLIAGFR